MNFMDPLPHLRLAKMLPETPLQCPVCKQNFKAIEGFAFLTFWHSEDEYGGRERKAGYLTISRLDPMEIPALRDWADGPLAQTTSEKAP